MWFDGCIEQCIYDNDPKKALTMMFLMTGTFQGDARVNINYPMTMIGAGQNKTFLSDCSLMIQGTTVEKSSKRVVLKDFTISKAKDSGLFTTSRSKHSCLLFLCDSMTFTQCGENGVYASTKGRLINCVVTQCELCGIYCSNTLIELEGSHTKVDGNVTSGVSYRYGLFTASSSSFIVVLKPLTKESVSTNNGGGGNYGGYGTILN